MGDDIMAPFGAFLLRITLGGLFLAHASVKYFVLTPAGTEHYFSSLGLPPELGLFTMVLEFIAGMMLTLGLLTRIVALLMIPDLLGAIYFVHLQNGFLFNNPGGGWEYPAFWAVALMVQMLIGGGMLAVSIEAQGKPA